MVTTVGAAVAASLLMAQAASDEGGDAVGGAMVATPNAVATVHQTWEVEYAVSPDSTEGEQCLLLEAECQKTSPDCTLVSSDSRRQLQQTSAPQCTAYVNNDRPGNTDAWCNSNCLHTPPNCPPSHCKCGAWAMPPPSPPAATADCMADTATPPMNPSAADYIDALRDYTPGLRAFEVCASCNACVAPVQTPAPTPVPTPAPTMSSATLVRTLESTVANPDPSLGAAIPDLKASGFEVAGTTFRGAEVVFTLTQQGGVAEAELLLVGALEPEAMRSLIGGSMGFDPAQSTFGVTVQQAVFPPRPPPMAPPTPPSPPPPTPPPPPPHPPPSTEVVVIRMTAHGDVEDYTPNVTASLQAKFATAAGVDASLVTIAVEPGSVLTTATIAVPAAMQSYAVRNLIKTKLGTPEAASAALGITVSSAPNFVITSNTASAPIVDAEAMQNEKQSLREAARRHHRRHLSRRHGHWPRRHPGRTPLSQGPEGGADARAQRQGRCLHQESDRPPHRRAAGGQGGRLRLMDGRCARRRLGACRRCFLGLQG